MMHAEMGSTVLWLMLLLGAYHGVNPGMGWLFAVALGMQEQKGSAVAKSLAPIALGHALAIGSVVMVAAFLGATLPLLSIRYSVAALLVGLGIFNLVCHWHPRWVRMRVGFGHVARFTEELRRENNVEHAEAGGNQSRPVDADPRCRRSDRGRHCSILELPDRLLDS